MADQVREAFLRWAKDNGFNVDARFENVGKLSQFLATEHAWQGWQAATASNAAEVEVLRADAERYRWLRDSGKYSPAWSGGGWGLAMGAHRYSASELDGAVDAARAALKGDKP